MNLDIINKVKNDNYPNEVHLLSAGKVEILVKTPDITIWKKWYQEYTGRGDRAQKTLVMSCLLYPEIPVFNEIIEKKPALINKFGESLIKLGGMIGRDEFDTETKEFINDLEKEGKLEKLKAEFSRFEIHPMRASGISCIFKSPGDVEWGAFQDEKETQGREALSGLVFSCALEPKSEELKKLVEKKPGIISIFGATLAELAGSKEEVEIKKV